VRYSAWDPLAFGTHGSPDQTLMLRPVLAASRVSFAWAAWTVRPVRSRQVICPHTDNPPLQLRALMLWSHVELHCILSESVLPGAKVQKAVLAPLLRRSGHTVALNLCLHASLC
jgi:hypothetical protein